MSGEEEIQTRRNRVAQIVEEVARMNVWAREIVENLESHIGDIDVLDNQIAKVALIEDLEQLKHFLYSEKL